jgi:hypothetical protein
MYFSATLFLVCASRALSEPAPVSALSVDAALLAGIPLTFTAESARALVSARAAPPASNASGLLEHAAALSQLAALAGSAAEVGARESFSAWALLAGLAGDAPARSGKRFVRVSPVGAAAGGFEAALVAPLARALGVTIATPDELAETVDVLLLDGARRYGALSRALAALAPRVALFIAVPHTEAFGLVSETVRRGEDASATGAARGWPALEAASGVKAALFDFLAAGSAREWALSAHFPNGGGLTILRRIGSS